MYVMFTEVTNVKSRSPPQLLQWTDDEKSWLMRLVSTGLTDLWANNRHIITPTHGTHMKKMLTRVLRVLYP